MEIETILIDSRERQPLPFPAYLPVLHSTRPSTVRLATKRTTLVTGDYALLSNPHCLIERKGSLHELCSNLLTRDLDRQLRAFDRLAAAPAPYLLLEGSPLSLTRPTTAHPEPWRALDLLFHHLASRRITLLLCSTRTLAERHATGELVARLLLTHARHSPNSSRPVTANTGSHPPDR